MADLKQLNKQRWDAMHIPAANGPAFKAVADRLTASKARYQAVEKLTGVPWWFIAVTHYRESNQNWNTQLAQGDPLNKKSVHVPAGRGPFKTWEEGAVDALVNCAPYAARNKDWSVGGALAMLEKYNGLGYASKGVPSPYLWAGTDQYSKGKYIADGVYSATTVDKQLGVAGILKFMGVFNYPVVATTTSTAAVGIFASLYHFGEQALPYVLVATGIGLISWATYSFIQFRKNKQSVGQN